MSKQKLDIEREKLINDLVKLNAKTNLSIRMNSICDIADFIIAERKLIVNKLIDYTHHENKCICSQYRAGRSTSDGGYEALYGYGKNELWYKRGDNPVCSCGLNEIIKMAGVKL